MSYRLVFVSSALIEWKKLAPDLRRQFSSKLDDRLRMPHVPGDRLRGGGNRYKIKLRSAGYRLVYEVFDAELVVEVIAIGKRERGDVYRAASRR